MGREKSIGVGLNSDNIVTSVMEGSAGARAGLRLGDIVLGWQGHPLEGRRLQDVLRPAHVHILSIARVGALYAAQSRDSSGRAAAAPSCVDEDEETPLNEAARPAAPPLSRRDTARYDEIRRDTAAAAAAAAAATRGDALMPPKREACGSQHAKGRSAAVSASVSAAVRRPNIEAEAAHRSVAAFEQARIAKRSDAWAGESQEEEVMGVWAGAYNGDLAVSRKEEASEREEEEEEGEEEGEEEEEEVEEKEGEEAVDEESAAIAMFDAAAAMFGVAANGLGAPSQAPRAGVGGDATEGRLAKMDPEERAAERRNCLTVVPSSISNFDGGVAAPRNTTFTSTFLFAASASESADTSTTSPSTGREAASVARLLFILCLIIFAPAADTISTEVTVKRNVGG